MRIRRKAGGPTSTGRRTAAALAACGLFLLAHDGAIAGEPSSRPFQLAPSSDLALSGPADTARPSPACSGFEVLLPEERPTACPRVAEADETTAATAPAVPDPSPPLEQWFHRVFPYLIPVGVAAGGLENSLADSPLRPFRFVDEGYFGANTYAGGADKASHFVDYTIVTKEIAYVYEKLGYSERTSTLLGLGLGFLGGLSNEIGDGFNQYGFSFQDLAMDSAGAVTSAILLATNTTDLVGFRYGFLLPKSNVTCCMVPGPGRDYSNEIYTADLKLAGVARRLHVRPGPFRYLYYSVTYGSKFYPTGLPSLHERQVGFEIGLNFEEILNSLGARRDTWWGYGLHVVFDNTRFPFTSVGFQYDLNHGKWHGPGNGNQYSTTP